MTEGSERRSGYERSVRKHASRLGNVDPENIVWIFGSARTGSTWLGSMMDEIEGQTVWREPLVGELFGYLYYVRANHRRGRNFILGGEKETWLPAVRSFIIQVARSKYQELSRDNYLVIKEPNGSVGAPLLMEALPESRMIFLIRDPRDDAASTLDALGRGKWAARRAQWLSHGRVSGIDPDAAADDMDAIVRESANRYLLYARNTKQAYDAHEGRKVLVKYEELRADAFGELERIYSTLGIPVAEGELERAVQKHAWENIPEQNKGEGKFYRKAKPGGWQEDLTPAQAKVMETITVPLLEGFNLENTL